MAGGSALLAVAGACSNSGAGLTPRPAHAAPPAAPSCTLLYQPLTGIPQPGVLAQGLASYQIDRPMVLQQVRALQ